VGQAKFLASAGPVTISFPPAWEYAGPEAAVLPTFQFDYDGFTGKTGVVREATISWGLSETAQSVYQVSASQHYAGGSTTVAFPDLSGLRGFLHLPPAQVTVSWSASVEQASPGPNAGSPAGEILNRVSNFGSYLAP